MAQLVTKSTKHTQIKINAGVNMSYQKVGCFHDQLVHLLRTTYIHTITNDHKTPQGSRHKFSFFIFKFVCFVIEGAKHGLYQAWSMP